MRSVLYSHVLMLRFFHSCVYYSVEVLCVGLEEETLRFSLEKNTLHLTLGLILLATLMKFLWKFSAENDVVETGYGRYKVKKVKYRKKSFKGLISYKVCICELWSNVSLV